MTRTLLCALLWLPLLAAAEPGFTAADATDLRAGPYADAWLLTSLPAAAPLEILGRQGGWYQVKVNQQQGWVRMSSLRLGAPGARAGVLDGGRTAATQTVASTGVRGFGKGELQNATPDLAAVDGLEAGAIASADARGFAAQGGLKAKAGAQ